MNESDIVKIESTLGVTLPHGYRSFLLVDRITNEIDDTTVATDADVIIQATQTYRAGFAGLASWPENLIYVGDEADACPYVIDCCNGNVRRVDKGNLTRPPLERFVSFDAFLEQYRNKARAQVSPAARRRNGVFFYAPMVIGIVGVFLVLPAVVYTASLLFHWVFK